MPGLQLFIRPNSIVLALGFIALFFLLMSIGTQTACFLGGAENTWLFRLFNVDNEGNFPSFFSVVIILANSVLLLITALASQATTRHESHYWFSLAVGFLFLAYDEGFQVHEKLGEPMRAVLGPGELGVFYFGWVIPGLLGVGLLSLLFMKFLFRLPPLTRRHLLTSAALYFGGCLGMEMLVGAYAEGHGYDYTYNVMVTIEEGLEMAGMIMLVHTLLNHLARSHGHLAFALQTQHGHGQHRQASPISTSVR